MNIVGIAMFLSFSASIGFCAWLAVRGSVGASILLALFVLLFLGSVKISTTVIATCPKCGHRFEVKNNK